MPITDNRLIKKANDLKRPLLHKKTSAKAVVKFQKNAKKYQNLEIVKLSEPKMPLMLKNGSSVILDFEDHCVGYLNFSLNHETPGRLCDSPIRLMFNFGEFPLEIEASPEDYKGWLGNGWLQNETRSFVFMPYTGILERRYSFRYVKITRLDNAPLNILLTDIFADCVSAVSLENVPELQIPDAKLRKIYDMSVKTLKECEQDVYEDGPKRDRRLWIGDLRLQALTDYGCFENLTLIKRCIYLFAGHRTQTGAVSPCVFPNSPPYNDDWVFGDYSLFFISCLYDYAKHTSELSLPRELYGIALEQIKIISSKFDRNKNSINEDFFIDWCEGLDKTVSALGVYLYTLRQLVELADIVGTDEGVSFAEAEISRTEKALLSYFDSEKGVFVAPNGQISLHSQVWGILSGALTYGESQKLMESTEKLTPDCIMHTPYMMHYYIEALFSCGAREKAIDFIRSYWGEIADTGLDCCPEIYNPENLLESPYNAPEINSACHAWSCTPAYWIKKYYNN